MCAFLYDSPTRHHCYDVSSLNGRQPVSDDNAGSSYSGFIQCRLDRLQENGDVSETLDFVCDLQKRLPGFMVFGGV